jgi:ubiquinone/menaquinone biosynthesis C-methylase UbiE
VITILDIGAGGADLGAILRPLERRFAVTALDINPRMREFAKRHGHASEMVIGSAHDLAYPDRSFDIVHASLFLHHCTDAEARWLLQQAIRIARVGVVINELHRNILALGGIALLMTLFENSPIVRHDALLSVRRGFTRGELAALTPRPPVGNHRLSWHWAFRWCLCITPLRRGADG